MDHRSVVLDRVSRRRVTKLDRRTRDAHLRIRCRVLLKVSQGLSRRAAARELGCAPSTAWWIVERFRVRGEASLFDGRGENGARKVDEDVHGALREILMKTPPDFGYERSSWSLELLARVLAERVGAKRIGPAASDEGRRRQPVAERHAGRRVWSQQRCENGDEDEQEQKPQRPDDHGRRPLPPPGPRRDRGVPRGRRRHQWGRTLGSSAT